MGVPRLLCAKTRFVSIAAIPHILFNMCRQIGFALRATTIMVKYMQMKAKSDSVARLSSKADYTIFSYGGKSIRFAAPYSLRRYLRVTKWHDGYMEVEADYGAGAEEDYIDLRPVLRNLMIDPKRFLKSVKKVEVSYA